MLTINWKNWKFYYRILFGLLILCALFYNLFNGWINGIILSDDVKLEAKNWEWFIQDKGDFSLNFFTYFTIQTNLLVGIWLLFSALFENIQHNLVKKICSYSFTLGVTIYISITGIIFNTLLLPTVINETSVLFWFITGTSHMVCPVVMIIYFVLMQKQRESIKPMKQFLKNQLWIYYIYPLIWTIAMLIRGEFRYQAGKAYAYQYFFLNMHKSTFGLSGAFWFVVAGIFIVGIVLGLGSLYNWISLKQVSKT